MTILKFDISLKPYKAMEHIEEIEHALTTGWQVLNISTYWFNQEQYERWTIHKDETKAAATPLLANVQVRAIVSVECRETYSKSTQQYFKFWSCELENGEKVNIFNHLTMLSIDVSGINRLAIHRRYPTEYHPYRRAIRHRGSLVASQHRYSSA